MLCLRKMASAVWGITQHRNSGGCSFSSLPRATKPRLSSNSSSPLCPPTDKAQGKWLQTNFLCWPFKRLSVSSKGSLNHLSLMDRNPAAFHSCMLFAFLSWFWWCRLGSSAWGLDPTLRGIPLSAEISLCNFSCHPWEHSQSSHASPASPISQAVMKWFLPSVCGYKASLQLVFSWLFRMIFL